jgi:hypothetical protein
MAEAMVRSPNTAAQRTNGRLETRERRGHHQHRGRVVLALTTRQRLMREPQVALDLEPRLVDHTVGRVTRGVLRPGHCDLRPERRRGSRPANPLREGRGRHRRRLHQQLSNLGSKRIKTRHSDCPLIFRRPIQLHRSVHPSPGNPHDPADHPLRVFTRRKQEAYLRPIIQIDHLP